MRENSTVPQTPATAATPFPAPGPDPVGPRARVGNSGRGERRASRTTTRRRRRRRRRKRKSESRRRKKRTRRTEKYTRDAEKWNILWDVGPPPTSLGRIGWAPGGRAHALLGVGSGSGGATCRRRPVERSKRLSTGYCSVGIFGRLGWSLLRLWRTWRRGRGGGVGAGEARGRAPPGSPLSRRVEWTV